MKQSNRISLPSRQGYVLITTVLVMALVSLLLVNIANQSMRLATSAALEEEALQSRWASVSAQHAVLRNAERILNYQQFSVYIQEVRRKAEAAIASDDEPPTLDIDWRLVFPTNLSFRLELNGREHQFLLADENCKVNLENIRFLKSAEVSRTVLSKFLRQGSDFRQQRLLDQVSWESWGQLLQTNNRKLHLQGIEKATTQVTLWGNARVNYLRCTDEVFRVTAEQGLLKTDARKLLELRQEHPTWKLSDLLRATELPEEEHQQVRGLFQSDARSLGVSPEPNTFSLWMRVSDRQSLQFHLIATTPRPQHLSFVW